MPIKNNNRVAGLPPSSVFQVGVSNTDDDTVIEQDIRISWPSDPIGSYLYYDCSVSVVLDSGIVTHNTLPQVDGEADTLASVFLDRPGPDKVAGPGVNIKSNDKYQDIVQRMGHSRYWFVLSGQALRVGHRVPIPGMKTIGGVPAVSHDNNPQRAFNRVMPGGNYGGVILWHAQWSLWYTTAVPPYAQTIPEVDMAAHISGATPPPKSIQSPYSQADDNAEPLMFEGFGPV